MLHIPISRWGEPYKSLELDKVVHFEIPFDDKQRAMKFYGEAFGWKLTDMAGMDYVMTESVAVDEKRRPKEPGAINGGLFQRPKEADPGHGRLRARDRQRGQRRRSV